MALGFVAAVASHHDGKGWPAGQERTALRFRRTDLVVQETTGIWPLSVSSDKLGVTAMRCAHLQARWAQEAWSDAAAPRDGSGPLVEVYPAPALKVAGLPYRSYKGTEGRQQREAILLQLARGVGLADVAERALMSDHVLDGLVSALAAHAAAEGRTLRPAPGAETDTALIEGWIHVPRRLIGC
jgi:hypothetical protein